MSCTDQQESPITASMVNTNNSSSITFHEFTKAHRQEAILREFEFIAGNLIDGVHVFPSVKSLQVWYGVIFVRKGPFAEGIFHYKIILSDDYPYVKPCIRFESNVFHPQVNSSGILNLNSKLNYWKETKSQIWEALKYLHECFYDVNTCYASNDEAAHVFSSNMEEFKARARSCVLESLLEFEEQETDVNNMDSETDNPFNCKLLSPRDNATLKKIFHLKNLGTENEDLLSWTKYTVGKMFSTISNYSINGLSPQSNKVTPGS